MKTVPLISLEQFETLFLHKEKKEEIDPALLRYAIYARKSSEEPDKQIRSLDDQILECKALAEQIGANVKEENIIQESCSAKTSGIRPEFKKLMARFRKGELDGLITWHPDRLSRNMLEAGEVIDMLDSGILLDLRFVSHPFTNDPAGKMLLGILFVMAKQYSEKLAIDIRRGNTGVINEGKKIGVPLHGYIKDRNGWLVPDGENFSIINEAFRHRLAGRTLVQICDFINKSGYFGRTSKGERKPVRFTPSTLSNLFKSKFYFGYLEWGENIIKLSDHYDFEQIITFDEWQRINTFSDIAKEFKTKASPRRVETKKADLLTNEVFCFHCNNKMQAQTPKSARGVLYYSFRCKTVGCPRHNKGTRMKIIQDFVLDFLSQQPFNSKEAYASYEKEMVRLQRQNTLNIRSEIGRVTNEVGLLGKDIDLVNKNLARETDEDTKQAQKDELRRLKQTLVARQEDLAGLQKKKTDIEKAPLTYEQFLAVIEKIPAEIKKVQSTTALNSILTKMFLNFSVSAKKVEKYTLNTPFDSLVRADFSSGGDGGS